MSKNRRPIAFVFLYLSSNSSIYLSLYIYIRSFEHSHWSYSVSGLLTMPTLPIHLDRAQWDHQEGKQEIYKQKITFDSYINKWKIWSTCFIFHEGCIYTTERELKRKSNISFFVFIYSYISRYAASPPSSRNGSGRYGSPSRSSSSRRPARRSPPPPSSGSSRSRR